MALSESKVRVIYEPGPPMRTYDAPASVAFKQGSMVAIDTADGLLKLVSAATTLKIVGASARELDTTGLAADKRIIPVDHGIIGDFETAGGADEITADDLYKDCYGVDDDTVALTDGGGTRSRAGTIWGVTDEGRVIVQFEVTR